MALTVNILKGTMPANNAGFSYRGALQTNNVARTDLAIRVDSVTRNADGSGIICVTIEQAPMNSNNTFIQDDGQYTMITGSNPGFIVRTGSTGYNGIRVPIQMNFDATSGLPGTFQIQLGGKGGGNTPNSGYTFSKTRVVIDEEEEMISEE
jgi:hypothetical protein